DLDVLKQQGELYNSSDRTAREEAFKKRYAGYASQRDIYAFAITKLVKARNEVSRLRHYPDNPHDVHFGLYLSTPEVKSIFEQIASQGEFNKRYQRLRADHIKKIANIDDVHVWDMSVIPPALQRPRFTIGDATRTIKETMKPF